MNLVVIPFSARFMKNLVKVGSVCDNERRLTDLHTCIDALTQRPRALEQLNGA
jgi:hypothetical protein